MTQAREKFRDELHDALANLHADLDRVELLAAALDAFSAPVPGYERFHHVGAHTSKLKDHELRVGDKR